MLQNFSFLVVFGERILNEKAFLISKLILPCLLFTHQSVVYRAFNQLTELPDEIGKLPLLTLLDLNCNQLIALPRELGALTQLTELYIAGNRLTELPLEIVNLTKLNVLDLTSYTGQIPSALLSKPDLAIFR